MSDSPKSRAALITWVTVGAAVALAISPETIASLQATPNLQQKLEIVRAAKQAGDLKIQHSQGEIVRFAEERSFRDK